MQIKIENTGKSIDQIVAQLSVLINRTLPVKIGNTAVLFFKDNIRQRQGFLDIQLDGWEANKTTVLQKPGKKMLIERGNLLSGITHSFNGSTIMVYVIGAAKKYAEIHNTGGTIPVTPKMAKFFWAKYFEANKQIGTGKSQKAKQMSELANYYKNMALAKEIVIPKRKYIGDSFELNKAIKILIEKELNTILNN